MSGGGHSRLTDDDVLDLVPVGVLVVDAGGQALAANRAWSALTGLTREDSLAGGWTAVLPPGVRQPFIDQLEDVGADDAADTQVELLVGGSFRWTRWWARRTATGGMVLAVADASDEEGRTADLARRASHDPLTGLVNRPHFLSFVDRALRRTHRRPGQVAVLFIDLDGFKRVNDEGGHRSGDRVLEAVAERLRQVIRPDDVVARIGGDEFAVLCVDLAGADDAEAVARRVQGAFASGLEAEGEVWSIGASVGIALASTDVTTPEDLLHAADQAMYAARQARSALGQA